MKKRKPSPHELEAMWKDPNNWKWYLFYFNPCDPRIWVPKRQKMLGITLNFARVGSWLILFGMILAIVMFDQLLRR